MSEDILDTTVPEGIPGELFKNMVGILLATYKPGTIINTAQGAGTRAEKVAVQLLEVMVDFYEAVSAAEEEQ